MSLIWSFETDPYGFKSEISVVKKGFDSAGSGTRVTD